MNGSDSGFRRKMPSPNPAKSSEQRIHELENDVKTLAHAVMFLLEAYVDEPEKTVARTPK